MDGSVEALLTLDPTCLSEDDLLARLVQAQRLVHESPDTPELHEAGGSVRRGCWSGPRPARHRSSDAASPPKRS